MTMSPFEIQSMHTLKHIVSASSDVLQVSCIGILTLNTKVYTDAVFIGELRGGDRRTVTAAFYHLHGPYIKPEGASLVSAVDD